MALVRLKNSELSVPDDKVAEYLEMGYAEIDANGNEVKKPVVKTVAEMEKRAIEAEAKVEELSAIVECLEKQIEEADAKIAELTAERDGLAETLKKADAKPAETKKK